MKLKKGWTNLLIIISFMSMLLIAGECESTLFYMIKAVVGIIIFVICDVLLIKYGRF